MPAQAAAPVGKFIIKQGIKAAFGGFRRDAKREKQHDESRRDKEEKF